MADSRTPTSEILDYLIAEENFSVDFIHDVTKYSPKLLHDARLGYITFFGHTFARLEALKTFCDEVHNTAEATLTPQQILEDHVLVYKRGDEKVYASFGSLIIAGEKDYTDAVFAAHFLEQPLTKENVIASEVGIKEDDTVVYALESRRYEVAQKRGRFTPMKRLS